MNNRSDCKFYCYEILNLYIYVFFICRGFRCLRNQFWGEKFKLLCRNNTLGRNPDIKIDDSKSQEENCSVLKTS